MVGERVKKNRRRFFLLERRDIIDQWFAPLRKQTTRTRMAAYIGRRTERFNDSATLECYG